VATLCIEIDRFRAELHLIVEQFLDNNGWHGTGTARPAIGAPAATGCSPAPTHGKHAPTGPEHDEDASDKSTTEPLMSLGRSHDADRQQCGKWRPALSAWGRGAGRAAAEVPEPHGIMTPGTATRPSTQG
jgi:hypothetical protein